MKFHRLTVKNINSLYGEHCLDFEKDLDSAPLFLIMGPTGAGKSTLLDAICLALFGTTPRQRELRSGADVAEHVMSRGRGEAEVTLQFSRLDPEKGRLFYEAGWYCNRAYNKPDGKMQAPMRNLDLLLGETRQPLVTKESRKSYYDEHFDEALARMTLDDFLRSVLLAQGDFTAFLYADETAKADILEKLTNSEQYKLIGHRAMRRWQRARDSVEGIKSQMGMVNVRSQDEFALLLKHRDELTAKAAIAEESLKAARARHGWLLRARELGAAEKQAVQALEKAQVVVAERRPDFERLEQAERARPAQMILRNSNELAAEIEARATRQTELLKERDRLQESFDKGAKELLSLQEAWATAQKALDDAAGDLQQARALRQELGLAQKSSAEADKLKESAEQALSETKTGLEKAQRALAEATARQEETSKALGELAQFQGLEAALSGLKGGVESLDAALVRQSKEQEKKKSLQTSIGGLQKELQALKTALEKETARLSPLQEEEQSAAGQLASLLDGASSPGERRKALQTERDLLVTRLSTLKNTSEKLDVFVALGRSRDSLLEQLEEQTRQKETLTAELEDLESRQKSTAELVATRKTLVELSYEPLRLSKEREKLVDGNPCPLCGSPDHPFTSKTHDISGLTTAHEQAKQDLEEVEKRLVRHGEERRKLEREAASVAERLKIYAEQKADLLRDEKKQARSLAELAANLELDFDAEKLDAFAAALQTTQKKTLEKQGRHQKSIKAFDEAEARLAKAREALGGSRAALDELQRQRDLKAQALELSEKQLEELEGSLKGTEEELATLKRTLSASFESVGIEVLATAVQEAFRTALTTAEKSERLYREAHQAHEKARQALQQERQKAEHFQTLLPERTEAFSKAQESLRTCADQVSSLGAKLTELFDGQDPDVVEKALKEGLTKATKAVESARTAQQERKEELQRTIVTLANLKDQQKAAEEKQKELQEKLAAAIEEAQLSSVEELQACLLDEEAFAALKKALDSLRDELTRATTTFENATKALKEHQKTRPEGLAETEQEETTLEQLSAEVAAGQDEFKDLTRQEGSVAKEIEKEREQQSRHAELSATLNEAARDLRRWETIHKLIGEQKGLSFKKFAQALNLERIVYHANEHLKQLRDRYRLIVPRDSSNHPRLAFEIIDRYQGNSTRAISTLSGGETFLVSLALALALADFRQVRMPVETLLLDEGFGTLDQDALREAVTVLKALHARDNRQVGVISHVEQLQEQIEHRILVERSGGGMSTISVESPKVTVAC